MRSEDLARVPLLTETSARTLEALREHPDAPRYNHRAGDRVTAADLVALEALRANLRVRRPLGAGPSSAVLAWVSERSDDIESWRRRLPPRFEARFEEIRTVQREDLATAPETFVPDGADLSSMLVYRTAGTTGHALLVPHHARAAASYLPLLEWALAAHGVHLPLSPDRVACFLVGAQARTVTYPTILSAWQGAGFAKLNLHQGDWPKPGSQGRYFEAFAPPLLTGDPISFSELLRLEIQVRPQALVSTAVAMSPRLKARLAATFGARVIDWYSLTETGPLGYACPLGEGYHQLPTDVYLEALDSAGRRVGPGERGELTVTGGRNPFLPLLRYRTGDFGRLDEQPCACGDPLPRILDLEGRAPVLFRAHDDQVINPVDLSRILREHPFVQHELHQGRDRALRLVVRVIPGLTPDLGRVRGELLSLFGPLPLELSVDPQLGQRQAEKVLPYQSELLLED